MYVYQRTVTLKLESRPRTFKNELLNGSCVRKKGFQGMRKMKV